MNIYLWDLPQSSGILSLTFLLCLCMSCLLVKWRSGAGVPPGDW